MATVLLATDSERVFDYVDAALADPDTTVHRVRAGADVLPALLELDPELVVLDMQIGNMGGVATCMAIRHEEKADRIDVTAVLMLLDREADIFLAKRCEADGWLVRPLDAFRLRRATETLLSGYSYFEGIEDEPPVSEDLPTPA